MCINRFIFNVDATNAHLVCVPCTYTEVEVRTGLETQPQIFVGKKLWPTLVGATYTPASMVFMVGSMCPVAYCVCVCSYRTVPKPIEMSYIEGCIAIYSHVQAIVCSCSCLYGTTSPGRTRPRSSITLPSSELHWMPPRCLSSRGSQERRGRDTHRS